MKQLLLANKTKFLSLNTCTPLYKKGTSNELPANASVALVEANLPEKKTNLIVIAFHPTERRNYLYFMDYKEGLSKELNDFRLIKTGAIRYTQLDWYSTDQSYQEISKQVSKSNFNSPDEKDGTTADPEENWGLAMSPPSEVKKQSVNFTKAKAALISRKSSDDVSGEKKLLATLTDVEISSLLVYTPRRLSATINENFKKKLQLESLRRECLNKLDNEYISCWKMSWFGHHHNDRASAVRQSIATAATYDEIKQVIDSQTFFSNHVDVKENKTAPVIAGLDKRWTEKIKNKPNLTKGFFKAIIELDAKIKKLENTFTKKVK